MTSETKMLTGFPDHLTVTMAKAAVGAMGLSVVGEVLDALRDRVMQNEADAARYRFLRDNPLALRAVDGNASPRSFTAYGFDQNVDRAMSRSLSPGEGQPNG